MIKKTLSILLLIGTVVAVIFAAINSSKSQSLLMQYFEKSTTQQPQTEQTIPCDSIPCDSLQVVE